ncbi:c-type cytochrome [Rhodophyticola sp. SM2404]
MKRKIDMTAALVTISALALMGLGHVSTAQAVTLEVDNPQIVLNGSRIYDENCASCHGANLEGQPDWRARDADGRLPAPPHDESGHTWHHDSEALFALTKYGIAAVINNPDYPSNMPAYEGILSDDDIIAVLSYIKSTWPDDIRAIHDEIDQ